MLTGKVAVPSADTDGPPALATLNGTLYVAYQGHHSTSLWWTTNENGWSGEAQVPNAASALGPALAAGDDLGLVFLLWRGIGADNTLYWSTLKPGGTWATPQAVPGGQSSSAPAAVVAGGTVHVAWKGAGADTAVYTCQFAGGTWSAGKPIAGAATSTSPTLAVLGDGILAAWRGAGDEHISTSVLGHGSWSPPQVVPGVGSSAAPALRGAPSSSGDPRAYLMWKGAGADTALYYTTFGNGSWRPQQAAGGTSKSAPALALFQNEIVAAWTDPSAATIWWSPFASSGPPARKFSYLLGVVEATGIVQNFAEWTGPKDPNNPDGTNPDGFDLDVMPGWAGITGTAPASLHCETYPEGIAVVPPPNPPLSIGIDVNHIPTVNRFEPYEPWGTTPFTAKWPNTPGMPPEQPDPRPFQLIGPTGQSADLKRHDRVRLRGRLLVENGHASPPPWGGTWFELHPFDYHNLQVDISAPGIGSGGFTTHTVLLIAPLFGHAYAKAQRHVVGPSPFDLYDTFDPYVGPGAALYAHRSEIRNCRLWGPGPLPGPPAGIPAGAAVGYREIVMINTTGKALDELRTVTADADGLLVSAAVEAPETIKGYDFDLADFADPAHNRGVLLIRYEVYWPQRPGSLLLTQHHTDGAWLAPPLPAPAPGRPVAVAGTSDAPGQSQFVVSLADGGLLHTTGSAGSFTAPTPVKDRVGGAIGQVIGIGAASAEPGLAQFMFALADGRLLHTTRRAADQGWYQVGDVKAQIGDVGHVVAIAGCGDPAKPGASEWVLATEEGGLWHTVRRADGTWTSAGNVKVQIGDIGRTIAAAAVGTPTDQGTVQFAFVTADDHVWHTTRHTDTGVWLPRVEVKSQVGDFGIAATAAAVSSRAGYSQFLFATADGRLYHTTRKPDHTWYPAGVVMGQIGDIGQAGPVAAAAAQPDVADFLIAAFDTTPDPGQGPT
jgi:hypothetical protein